MSSSDEYDTELEDVFDGTRLVRTVSRTNEDVYLHACTEYDVIPLSYYLRHITSPTLNLAHVGLRLPEIKALVKAVSSNAYHLHLNFSYNPLCAEGCLYISQMLVDNSFITELDLSNNNIGLEGLTKICNLLNQTDILRKLSLEGNKLDKRCSKVLEQCLKRNKSLHFLNLSRNCFCEDSGEHFANTISTNESLEELDLSWNYFRLAAAYAIAQSLKENMTLKKLDVSWNGFADDGMIVLANSLKINSSLHILDISSNRISHLGAEHLSKALSENEGLQVLKIGHNPLQHGSLSIIQAIHENAQKALLDLDLSGVQVTEEFMKVAEIIAQKTPAFRVYHGGLGGMGRESERPNPMKVLRDYMRKNEMRILDFFKRIDKDKSMAISVEELAKGLKEVGVPLQLDDLLMLVHSLDLDGDGEVDYQELVKGNEAIKIEERIDVVKEKEEEKRQARLFTPGNKAGRGNSNKS